MKAEQNTSIKNDVSIGSKFEIIWILFVFMTSALFFIFMPIIYLIHHLSYINPRDGPKEYILQIDKDENGTEISRTEPYRFHI